MSWVDVPETRKVVADAIRQMADRVEGGDFLALRLSAMVSIGSPELVEATGDGWPVVDTSKPLRMTEAAVWVELPALGELELPERES